MGFKDSVFKRECENNGIELYIRNIVDLTKEELNEIVRLNTEDEYGLGMLCEKFQYTYGYLTNQLNKNNITLKRYLHGKRVIFSEDEINKMFELNQQGFSREYIADCFNTYEDMISKTIKRSNLNFMDNRFSNITEELFEVIKQRNDNGEGIHKIAEDLKLSHKTIANEFNKRNLKYITYSQYFNKEVGVNDGFLHYDSELMTKLTDEYKSGSSIRELCDKYSLNKKTLRQNLVFNDVEIRDFRVILSDENVGEIIALYDKGNSTKSIGERFNCNHGIIAETLKDNGIEVIDKKIYQFTDEQIKTMVTKYVDFEYDAETIGKMFDAPGIVIIKHLKLNGVETRSSNSSIPERLLNRFIKGFIDKDVLGNPRGFISSGEIDILSHKFKIGVEYNGLLWHSDKYEKGKNVNYHLNKTNELESKGYKLLHIFEDEYLDREFLIFNKILESFNIDKYVGSDFDYLKMLDFKTTEEFLSNVDKLYTLKDKINVTGCKIENNNSLEDVLISKLTLDIESDYNKSFYIKHENKKVGVITVKDNIIKEILINPVYKITDINKIR